MMRLNALTLGYLDELMRKPCFGGYGNRTKFFLCRCDVSVVRHLRQHRCVGLSHFGNRLVKLLFPPITI